MKTIKKIGAEKIVIWLPNKDIAKEVIVLLNRKKKNLACDQSHTHADSRVVVNWMRSSESRGVKNSRRVHIVVGNPNVPLHAYDYLAFMYPDYFDTIPELILKNIAKNHNISLDKIKEIIGTFHSPERIGYIEYRKETPNEIEAELISKISEQLRVGFVAADGWQGGSRAKDPKATDPSVLYLIGWNENDVYNMVQWGYDLQIFGNRKNVTDQFTLIRPPIVTHGGVENIVDWLDGKEHDPTLLLSKDFSELPLAIFYALTFYNRSVTSKEIWPNLSPNLQVGYDSENHRNGFFVAHNRCLKSDSIQVTETSPGEFEYCYGSSAGIDIPEKELVFKILLTAYRSNKKEVFIRDIKKGNNSDKKLTTISVKRAFKIIEEHGLLDGSSWSVEQYDITKGKHKGKNHWKFVKK